MKFQDLYLTRVPDRTFRISGYVDTLNKGKEKNVFIDNNCYVDEDDNLWIFTAKKPKAYNEYPFFWINKNGIKEFSDPPELIKKQFNLANAENFSLVNIINLTEPGEVLYNEEEIADMNSASAIYTPIIKESDDFLKKIIKTTIIQKGIDVNRLKVKTDAKYVLSNMIAALRNDTKMSVIYFQKWVELLGVTFDITIIDNGTDTIDPLKNTLIYQSDKNKVMKINNDNTIVDINTNIPVNEEEESD